MRRRKNFCIAVIFINLFVAGLGSLAYSQELHVAAIESDIEKLKELIANGADVNAKNEHGQTPLHHSYDIEVAKLLIANGADVNAKDYYGNTPIRDTYDIEVARLLIENGADVKATNKYGETSLHSRVFQLKPEMAKLLIANGADVDAKDEDGNTPLFSTYDFEVAKLLIANGADVNAKNAVNSTPLHCVTDPEVVKILIANGADLKAKQLQGDMPIHTAASRDSEESLEVVKLLLLNGTDVNAKGSMGLSPLARVETAAMAKLLISKGADVNAKNDGGETPLFSNLNAEVIKILIENGADVSAKNEKGESPVTLAEKRGNKELAALLRKHGGPSKRALIKKSMEQVIPPQLKGHYHSSGSFPLGNIHWRVEIPHSSPDSSPALSDGLLYIANRDRIFSIDKEKGQIRWNFKAIENDTFSSDPEIYNGTVIIGTWDEGIICLGSTTGEEVWRFTIDQGYDEMKQDGPNGYVAVNIKILSDRLLAVGFGGIGGNNGIIWCINPKDGSLLWKINLKRRIHVAPLIHNSKLYFVLSREILCVSIEDGEILWQKDIGGNTFDPSCSPILDNDMLYVSSRDKIYALDVNTKNILWLFTINENKGINSDILSYANSNLISYKNHVYFRSFDGFMYALAKKNGTVAWKTKLREPFRSGVRWTPHIAFVDNTLYVPTGIGNLYALNPEDGKLFWVIKLDGPCCAGPIVFDGKIYIPSGSYLYSLN